MSEASLQSSVMPGAPAGQIRAAVEQVSAGAEFVRSARMVRFLKYIAEQSLSDKPELSERQIGVAVFDRGLDWDPKLDPIVRIEARRLRDKLEKHYNSLSITPEIVLVVPKGSYRLESQMTALTSVPVNEAGPVQAPTLLELPASQAVPLVPPAVLPKRSPRRGWLSVVALAAAFALLAVMGLFARHASVRVSEDRAIQIVGFKLSPGAVKLGDSNGLAGVLADQIRSLQSKTRISWPHSAVDDAWTQESPTSFWLRLWRRLEGLALSDDMFHSQQAKVFCSIEQPDAEHISIYVRGNGIESKTFIGEASGLQTLLAHVAEYLYAECQPSAYDVYLTEAWRDEEAVRFSESHYGRATHVGDKNQILFSWASALDDLGKPDAAAEKYRASIDLFPQSWGAYTALMSTWFQRGDAERALETGEALERATHRGSWLYAHLPAFLFRPTRMDTFDAIDQLRKDSESVKRAMEEELKATSGAGIHVTGIGSAYAETLAQLHEWRQARLELQAAAGSKTSDPGFVLEAAVAIARASNDISTLTSLLNEKRALLTDAKQPMLTMDEDVCSMAIPYEMIGDKTTADLLMNGHRGSAGCLTVEADILKMRGNTEQANQRYLEAIGKGPRLPVPHYRYGVFLAGCQRNAEAGSQFRLAHEYGPHWAEPLKAMADLDLSAGKAAEAFKEFAAASTFAPKWRELYVDWGTGLLRAGEQNNGNDKLRMAASF